MKKLTFILSITLTLCANAQVPSYVPTNGLVGWWPFNGNANDESGNGNNGTVNGATLTADRFGNMDEAYSFDGVGNYIDLGNPSVLGNNPTSYTQAGWVSFFDFSDAFVFMSKRHDNSGNDWATPVAGTNGKFIFFADDAFYQNAPMAESNVLIVNQWYHVVFVKSLDNYSIYVDGLLIDNISDSHVMGGSNNNLIVGAQLAWPEYFKGKIDDIGVWNRALTACEIQDLYNAELNSLAVSGGSDQELCEGQSTSLFGTGANTYQWSNNIQNGVGFVPTATNSYILTGTDANGCVGTDTVTVTVNEVSSSTQTQTALDSYTWPVNGQTYLESGTYTAVIPNAAGCDSTITLELTLNFTGIESLQFNATKTLIKITDLNGKETPFKKNTVLLFIYEDGTVERVYEVE